VPYRYRRKGCSVHVVRLHYTFAITNYNYLIQYQPEPEAQYHNQRGLVVVQYMCICVYS
jgi:hypothetical protein